VGGGDDLTGLNRSHATGQGLKVLFAIALFCTAVFLLRYSNLLTVLEGDNPDGSSPLTWRSGVAAVILFIVCLGVSSWAFRRRIALTAALGLAGCVACWHWLVNSKYGFEWEPHRVDGTFALTWRSDIVILGNVVLWAFLCFVVRQLVVACRKRNDI
jgi:hypothetical protein